MGETGCGKTRLIQFMCDIQKISLGKKEVHGGVTAQEIKEHLTKVIKDTPNNRRAYIFFDEINTANCMGLFKGTT